MKVIAITYFDVQVTLTETQDSFVVSYGSQSTTYMDFDSAWSEFLSCSALSAKCFGYVQDEDEE